MPVTLAWFRPALSIHHPAMRDNAMPLRTVLSRVALICLLGAIGAGTAASGDDERSGRRPGPAKPAEPFPLDLAFSRRDFSYFEKAAVSPDGSRVAYAVVTPMKCREDVWTLESGLPVIFRGARLHVVEVATRKAIALGAEGATSFAPAWSPDGTRLAYYSDEGGSLRAWIFDTGKGTSAPAADLTDQSPLPYHDGDAPDVESRRPETPRACPAGGRGRRRPEAVQGGGHDRPGEEAAGARRSRPHVGG